MRGMEVCNRVVRWSGIYDIIMTTPFAIPAIRSLKIAVLGTLHQVLDWGGDVRDFEPIHLMFMSLLGSIVSVWSVLSIFRPESVFGLYDSTARFLFSMHMILALTFGGTRIVLLVLVPETTWAIVQLPGYFLLSKSHVVANQVYSQQWTVRFPNLPEVDEYSVKTGKE
jgi:hypothetical protein